MAQLLARAAQDTKLNEASRAMVREWLVLLEQGKLNWEGVVQRIKELGANVENGVLS